MIVDPAVFIFSPPIQGTKSLHTNYQVTPFQTYYIRLASSHGRWYHENLMYADGFEYVNYFPQSEFHFLFRTEGYLAPNTELENCTQDIGFRLPFKLAL